MISKLGLTITELLDNEFFLLVRRDVAKYDILRFRFTHTHRMNCPIELGVMPLSVRVPTNDIGFELWVDNELLSKYYWNSMFIPSAAPDFAAIEAGAELYDFGHGRYDEDYIYYSCPPLIELGQFAGTGTIRGITIDFTSSSEELMWEISLPRPVIIDILKQGQAVWYCDDDEEDEDVSCSKQQEEL